MPAATPSRPRPGERAPRLLTPHPRPCLENAAGLKVHPSLQPSVPQLRFFSLSHPQRLPLCPSAVHQNSAPARREFSSPVSQAAASGPLTSEKRDSQRFLTLCPYRLCALGRDFFFFPLSLSFYFFSFKGTRISVHFSLFTPGSSIHLHRCQLGGEVFVPSPLSCLILSLSSYPFLPQQLFFPSASLFLFRTRLSYVTYVRRHACFVHTVEGLLLCMPASTGKLGFCCTKLSFELFSSSLYSASSSFCHSAPKCVVGGIVFSYTRLLQSRSAVCIPIHSACKWIIELRDPRPLMSSGWHCFLKSFYYFLEILYKF